MRAIALKQKKKTLEALKGSKKPKGILKAEKLTSICSVHITSVNYERKNDSCPAFLFLKCQVLRVDLLLKKKYSQHPLQQLIFCSIVCKILLLICLYQTNS